MSFGHPDGGLEHRRLRRHLTQSLPPYPPQVLACPAVEPEEMVDGPNGSSRKRSLWGPLKRSCLSRLIVVR